MSPRWTIGLIMIFVLCTVVSNVIELADPFAVEEDSVVYGLTAFSRITALDLVGVVTAGMEATGDFVAAIWDVLWFNYSFFYDVDPVTSVQTANEWTIVRYALFFPITVGLLFAFAMTIVSVVRGGGGAA